jgi:hypothetical protein
VSSAIVQGAWRRLVTVEIGFKPRQDHVGLVLDSVANVSAHLPIAILPMLHAV